MTIAGGDREGHRSFPDPSPDIHPDCTPGSRSPLARPLGSGGRDELLRVLSHDLRDALGTIRLATRALEAERRGDSEGRHLAAIRRSTEMLQGLVEDLLDADMIGSGELRLRPECVAVSDLLESVVEQYAATATTKDITLEVEGSPENGPGSGLHVRADRDRLGRVLSNLVRNALDFTAEGGTVSVRAGAAGDEVVFRVRDTGSGIPAEHVGHVFDRFWSHPGQRRTGLGLSIARGIVELHGGRIWVDSHPGEGTTFSFTVPRTSATDGGGGSTPDASGSAPADPDLSPSDADGLASVSRCGGGGTAPGGHLAVARRRCFRPPIGPTHLDFAATPGNGIDGP